MGECSLSRGPLLFGHQLGTHPSAILMTIVIGASRSVYWTLVQFLGRCGVLV